MTQTLEHFIAGHPHPGTGGRMSDIYNPASGAVIRRVPLADAAEVDGAVTAAREGFAAWSRVTPLERARVLFRYKQLLEENKGRLAELISEEHGKVRGDAAGEITRGIEVVEFACGAPHLLKGEMSPDVGTGVDSWSLREPLGVVAGITPFNFPFMVPMWMAPVALACGNAFILKPSERDPSASLLVAELLKQAGLPDGAFSVLHGDKEAVDRLLTHPEVAAVSFVGSTDVARHIYSTGTAHGKRVQALGGAKNHMVVMPDADLDGVVNALMGSVYGSAGERCMAISVAVPVTDAVADALVARLLPRVRALNIGPGSDPAAEMGPLVTAAHRAKVAGYLDIAEQEGAHVVLDGRDFKQDAPGCENGFFLGGSIIDHVKPGMRVHGEEIFGPVLSVVRAADYTSAVDIINAHPYANGTAIFTRDGDTARAFSRDIQVGMVGINVPIPVPMAYHSFGGWKASLFGDHAMHGMEGIRFHTRLKTVTSRWPKGMRDPEFVMPTMK